MNKEDRIRDSKKIYDATEIPSELSETVHQAIQQTQLRKGGNASIQTVWKTSSGYGSVFGDLFRCSIECQRTLCSSSCQGSGGGRHCPSRHLEKLRSGGRG